MQLRRLWPSIIWAIIILVLVGTPGNYFPEVVTFWDWLSPDKVIHLVIFGIQAYLLLYGFNIKCYSIGSFLISSSIIFLVAIAFSGLTEILQTYVFVGRYGNVYDFIADALGVIFGFVAYYLHNYKKNIARN